MSDTADFLKGYQAGVNDLEAGRLVAAGLLSPEDLPEPPEPTEAMVEALLMLESSEDGAPWAVERIKAVIAAAPPEWLLRGPEMNPDPHLLPDGSTSWGPDAPLEEPLKKIQQWGAKVTGSSVPEPTEAMVAAMRDAIGGRSKLGEAYKPMLEAAIAAAPPEWLLRAALTEEEIALVRLRLFGAEGVQNVDHRNRKTLDKFTRALRGREET